ncbi:YibE/F family protein [Brachybacterium hainanense]|uniref:YibE/F family protein n=1 Tax=Brachybacterium hainanense TaxID=1541174 RepID=A0ABV6RCC7_9MICO
MGSGHSHHPDGSAQMTASRGSRLTIIALTLVLLVSTLVGLVLLWPGAGAPRSALLAPGVELEDVVVVEVPEVLDAETVAPVTATREDGRSIAVEVYPAVLADLAPGDRIRVMAIDAGEEAGGTAYSYFDHQRTVPLALLLLAYLVVVAIVARGAGLRAVVGLAFGAGIVAWFMLPAILGGQDPVAVALVASGAMIFPSVYIAHGISLRTTTAVIGTFGGVVTTVLVALATRRPAGMTGADDETAGMLLGMHPDLSLSAVFLAGVILSGLGALNDVTITQASAVWELRAARPEGTRREIFSSAMRIGRDHIASTVYTLAYAYIGSALPVLLLASMIDRSIIATLTSGEIAAEVFRTLIASLGLVLAIPLTTGIATLLASTAPPAEQSDRHRSRTLPPTPEDAAASAMWTQEPAGPPGPGSTPDPARDPAGPPRHGRRRRL